MPPFGKADRIFVDQFAGVAQWYEAEARIVAEFEIGHHAASHAVGDGLPHAFAGRNLDHTLNGNAVIG